MNVLNMGKRLLVSVALVCLASMTWVGLPGKSFAYTHTGGLYTQAQIDWVKTKVQANEQPWKAGYDKLITDANAWASETPSAVAVWYVPGYYDNPSGHNAAKATMMDDAKAAYTSALAYQFTGNTSYAIKARDILNNWAYTNTSISGPDGDLAGAYIGVGFVMAAEWLDGYSGWSSTDKNQFKTWLANVYIPAININDTNNSGTWSAFARMAAYHYRDDTTGFTNMVNRLKTLIDGAVAADGHLSKETVRGDNGMWYTYFALAPMTAASQLVYNVTGENLFGGKLRAALLNFSYYTKYPNEWPYNSDPNFPGTFTSTSWPLNLYEAMGGVYGDSTFTGLVQSYRPLNGPLSSGNYHHFAWMYPTLMYNVLNFGTGSDTQAPSTPTNLTISGKTDTSASLTWMASTDNVAVMGYKVYRNGTLVKKTSSASITDIGLSASTSYTYTVKAYDAAENESAMSQSVIATTAATSNGGLVGYWKMDEVAGSTATDSSGYGLNGTLTNGPVWTTGHMNNGLSFDGTNDYVNIGNPVQLQLTGSMTLAAWVYVDSFANAGRIVAKQGASGSRGWSLNVEADGKASFQIASNSTTVQLVNSTSTIPTGQWVHLAGVYEPGSALRIYLNGTLNNSNTASIASVQYNNGLNVNIGRRPDAGLYFDGVIDEVRVYNQALSASDISGLASAAGLVGYWKMDEAAGTTAADSSGGGLIGTLKNGPVWTTGHTNNGLSVDGSNDYVDLGNPAQLQLTGSMTLAAWVYVDSFANAGRIVAKQGVSGSRGWSLNVEADGKASFQIASNSTTVQLVNSTSTIPTGQWVHLAGVYEPGSALRIYLNGTLNNSNTTSIASAQYNNGLNVNIGRRPDAGLYFDGVIDEVRVYNQALSASDISAIAS